VRLEMPAGPGLAGIFVAGGQTKGFGRMNDQVLVLNQNYEPLNVTNARRAVTLLYLGKAIVVETDSQVFRSPTVSYDMPSVVRLAYYVKRPTPQLKLTRRSIIARDAQRCQYCGKRAKLVTIDHVTSGNRSSRAFHGHSPVVEALRAGWSRRACANKQKIL